MAINDKETILVVDDEEAIREVTGEFFLQKGYAVISACNGLEAIEALEKTTVDCCLSDINMPGMDGMELAEHVRKKDPTIPVIIMTGYPSISNTIQTLKNGVVDFLIKPIKLDQLEVCITRVFRERRLFIDNILLKKEVEGKEKIEAINKELVKKVNDLNTFNTIMTEFTGIGSSNDLFETAVKLGVEFTGASETSFFIITDENESPGEVISARRNEQNAFGDVTLTINTNGTYADAPFERLIMEIVKDQVPLLITKCNGTRGLPDTIKSVMVVPLQIKKRIFGILTAVSDQDDVRFGKKEMLYFSFLAKKAASAVENIALYENIFETLFATLNALVRAVEARDEYTKMHSQRVAEISVGIGKEMGCSKEELDILNFAGKLHDIGKIGIRDIILLKEGKLTDEEFEIIKTHPEIGAKIVSTLGLWERETEVIRHHHEKFNGKGYPEGLKGAEIPFLARVMSVADAYDAMASDRAYRKRLDISKITSIITNESGEQFDPDVVDAFFKILEQGLVDVIRD